MICRVYGEKNTEERNEMDIDVNGERWQSEKLEFKWIEMYRTHHDSSEISFCVSSKQTKEKNVQTIFQLQHTYMKLRLQAVERAHIALSRPYQWWQNISLFDELWPSLNVCISKCAQKERMQSVNSFQPNMVWLLRAWASFVLLFFSLFLSSFSLSLHFLL